MKNLLYIILIFMVLSCKNQTTIELDKPIVVIKELPLLGRYKCSYKHANRTYYMHVISDKRLKKGDTLWVK